MCSSYFCLDSLDSRVLLISFSRVVSMCSVFFGFLGGRVRVTLLNLGNSAGAFVAVLLLASGIRFFLTAGPRTEEMSGLVEFCNEVLVFVDWIVASELEAEDTRLEISLGWQNVSASTGVSLTSFEGMGGDSSSRVVIGDSIFLPPKVCCNFSSRLCL